MFLWLMVVNKKIPGRDYVHRILVVTPDVSAYHKDFNPCLLSQEKSPQLHFMVPLVIFSPRVVMFCV